MTREEEINNAKNIFYKRILEEGSYYDPRDCFEEGAEWADTNPKSPWISTDKCLPRNGGHYLCNDGDNHISALAFCGDRWFNAITFNDIPLDVVKYWMPIPKLPKE